MFNRLQKVLATGAIASLLLTTTAAVPLMAAEDPGTSPAVAIAPGNDWTTLEPGQSIWYTFEYDYNVDDENPDPSQAIVEVETNVADSVSFEVWTSQSLEYRPDSDEYEPVGRGSAQIDDDKTLQWAGSAGASDTYYVVVSNERSVPSYFELTISGEDVTVPTMLSEASTAAETEATEEAAAETTAATAEMTETTEDASMTEETPVEGATADSAATPSEQWQTLDPGEARWYAFEFDYYEGNADTDPNRALVELEMDRAGAVHFEVWTPEQLRLWQLNEDFDPMGAGSVLLRGTEQADENTLVWTGTEQRSGTYYVVVENDSNDAASYSVEVNGSGVSF